MYILFAIVSLLLGDLIAALDGFYSYQVTEVNSDLALYCLSSGKDIKWFRKRDNAKKEELRSPDYQVSKSFRCGNPHLCGGYDVYDTKVCIRSTLRLKKLQKSDIGTYFCQEGTQQGTYSYAYVLNVLDKIEPPRIYDFSPLECNQSIWYGCVTTSNVARFEYFVNEKGEKVKLVGKDNATQISGKVIRYVVKENYITLSDYSVLENPEIKFGCRAYDENGSFSEYETGKAVKPMKRPKKQESYEMYLIKIIGIGVGVVVGIIILLVVSCKLRKWHNSRQNATTVEYTEIPGPTPTENVYTEPRATENGV